MTTTREASKQLSWLLRHGAGERGLAMDAAGWAAIDEVLRALQMRREALDDAVLHNDKGRLQIEGDRIRACQGHSVQGMPVTAGALEASWAPREGDAPVWHGTRVAAIEGIAREGIQPVRRTHVHLAESLDSVVGKRHEVEVMLEVAPAALRDRGIGLFRSPNGVVLARVVPPSAIVRLVPMTNRAKKQAAALAMRLGVPVG